MQVKTKMLQMSRKGQMGVGNLSVFAIQLLVVGIVVVVGFLIIGSFQTTLTKNGEATIAVNTSIGNVNSALSTISNTRIKILVVLVGIIAGIISAVILILVLGGRREEGRD